MSFRSARHRQSVASVSHRRSIPFSPPVYLGLRWATRLPRRSLAKAGHSPLSLVESALPFLHRRNLFRMRRSGNARGVWGPPFQISCSPVLLPTISPLPAIGLVFSRLRTLCRRFSLASLSFQQLTHSFCKYRGWGTPPTAAATEIGAVHSPTNGAPQRKSRLATPPGTRQNRRPCSRNRKPSGSRPAPKRSAAICAVWCARKNFQSSLAPRNGWPKATLGRCATCKTRAAANRKA